MPNLVAVLYKDGCDLGYVICRKSIQSSVEGVPLTNSDECTEARSKIQQVEVMPFV